MRRVLYETASQRMDRTRAELGEMQQRMGLLLLAARFADAVADPLLGIWSDRVGNRDRGGGGDDPRRAGRHG